MERPKFSHVSRVICPKTGIHYLDAATVDGEHYVAEMKTGIEKWIIWTKRWERSAIPHR